MQITVLIITDGRQECLMRTMKAMWANLHGPVDEVIIVDDSADPNYAAWLDAMYEDRATIVHHETRRGFGGAIQSGWDRLDIDTDWVFHLEDDFVLSRTVPLMKMISTLAGHPYLVQMALRRQPVNEEEIAAGGVIERWPAEYVERTSTKGSWLEHQLFFTTNPSVYRYSLTRMGWPQEDRSESAFTQRLLREGVRGTEATDLRFAFWGRRADKPWVEHIGDVRVGSGY